MSSESVESLRDISGGRRYVSVSIRENNNLALLCIHFEHNFNQDGRENDREERQERKKGRKGEEGG